MPHDVNWNLLKVGDHVSVECVVTGVQTGQDYCNVSLETVQPMYPGNYKTGISLNTKQVALIPVAEVA